MKSPTIKPDRRRRRNFPADMRTEKQSLNQRLKQALPVSEQVTCQAANNLPDNRREPPLMSPYPPAMTINIAKKLLAILSRAPEFPP